jgi:hypothetical protein
MCIELDIRETRVPEIRRIGLRFKRHVHDP